MDKDLDLKAYTHEFQEFIDERVGKFYVDFARRTGSRHVLLEVLHKMAMAASPILMYSSHEIFHFMPPVWFAHNIKPKTVYQMPSWRSDFSLDLIVADRELSQTQYLDHLSQFQRRDHFR